jgi:hypothetical protein
VADDVDFFEVDDNLDFVEEFTAVIKAGKRSRPAGS